MDRMGRNLGGCIPSCSQYWKCYNSSYDGTDWYDSWWSRPCNTSAAKPFPWYKVSRRETADLRVKHQHFSQHYSSSDAPMTSSLTSSEIPAPSEGLPPTVSHRGLRPGSSLTSSLHVTNYVIAYLYVPRHTFFTALSRF